MKKRLRCELLSAWCNEVTRDDGTHGYGTSDTTHTLVKKFQGCLRVCTWYKDTKYHRYVKDLLQIDNLLIPVPTADLVAESILTKPKGNIGHAQSLTIDKSTVIFCRHLIMSRCLQILLCR